MWFAAEGLHNVCWFFFCVYGAGLPTSLPASKLHQEKNSIGLNIYDFSIWKSYGADMEKELHSCEQKEAVCKTEGGGEVFSLLLTSSMCIW